MKRLILACCLTLCAWTAQASPSRTAQVDSTQAAPSQASPSQASPGQGDSTLTAKVNAFVDRWHDDAAHARPAYFDKIAKDGVYIGTDKSERWRRDEFKEWAKPHFQRKSAWAFKALRRNVQASDDGSMIWFDELLDTQMGVCQASGVMRRRGDSFEIVHYQLSMAVPNEVAGQVTKLIRDFETRDGWKGGAR